jgi:hypothetical protein
MDSRLFKNSAKPYGRDLGIRGRDASGDVTFLGFLSLAYEKARMTSSAVQHVAMHRSPKERKTRTALKILFL